MSETNIFRLDLSAATRIYVKKGLSETSFVIDVISAFTFQIIFLGDLQIKLIFRMKDSLSKINPNEILQLYIQCILPFMYLKGPLSSGRLCALWYIFSHTENTPFSKLLKLSFKSHSIVRFKPLAVVKFVFWGC